MGVIGLLLHISLMAAAEVCFFTALSPRRLLFYHFLLTVMLFGFGYPSLDAVFICVLVALIVLSFVAGRARKSALASICPQRLDVLPTATCASG